MIILLSALSCTEYDVYRNDKPQADTDPIDTSVPIEPTETPDIFITPNPVDFGYVLRDCPADPIEVTVTNRGLETLDISSITLQGDGDTAFFHNGQATSLEFDESITFTINFTPTLLFPYDLDLIVESNDPDEPQAVVNVLGQGASGALYEESFQQSYDPILDVLWVVDNSESMSNAIDNVRTNFESFIGEFLALNLDYQMAAVTTDMVNPDQSGKIQGQMIDASMSESQAESLFLSAVNAGAQGSANEKGLEATKAALSSPLINSTNAGFLRNNAALSVIVVSDEDDASSINTNDFVSFLNGLKSSPDLVRFSGFVGTVSDLNVSCDRLEGTKYIDAAYQTGGFIIDICTDNFNIAMQEVALAAAGLVVRFPLEQEPTSMSSITVTVDGQVVPQDLFNGWTYDARDNALIFHGDSIPENGSTVYVTYEIPASCNN
ncbi:MAG: hypothetical protein VXZ96_06885 [Myxococcota bacterium]|nr:hypothetical protein [Myxococcota bacterium]